MAYPTDRLYTKEHEWIQISGDTGVVGITDFAQQQLGDVVYVELPDVGKTITGGESFGSIESVKAVSELYAPVSGEVVAVNDALRQRPEVVNTDPHGTWLIRVKLSTPDQASGLLDAAAYDALVGQ